MLGVCDRMSPQLVASVESCQNDSTKKYKSNNKYANILTDVFIWSGHNLEQRDNSDIWVAVTVMLSR